MNALQRCEYVALRLVRRFLFDERLAHRLAGLLPYYRPSVGEQFPRRILDGQLADLALAGRRIDGARVLDVGGGRTDAGGRAAVAAGAASALVLEPYVAFDAVRDAALTAADPALAAVARGRVRRVRSFDEIADASVDLLLSHSVLEHVRDLERFLSDCRRVLAPGGAMLHQVDYRDHFFKYPYAFLTFDEATWTRWLDPGDLPRWRLGEQRRALAAAGFDGRVLRSESDPAAFAAVRPRLAPRFADGGDEVAVTGASLLAWIAR